MNDESAMNRAFRELIRDVPYEIANLANGSALIFSEMDRLNWAGFYRMEDGALVLGPFQGKPACIRIPLGKGVCGTAAAQDRTMRVPDVHEFPGHIACDSASRSELVIPVHRDGRVWGVLDLDSPEKDRFTRQDQEELEEFVKILEENL